MSRLDELRQLEADAVALKPRACGCPHELISSATGKIQFCAVAAQIKNPACYHRPDPDDVRKLVIRAMELALLTEDEGTRFCQEDHAIFNALGYIDEEAFLRSEELAENGELEGITDFENHWLVQEASDRQSSHVEDLQVILDTISMRAHGDIVRLTASSPECVHAA